MHRNQLRDRWQSYLDHHRFSARDSLKRLLSTPLQSLMTWLVIAVALALPATLFTSLDNLKMIGQRWDGAPQITLFLNQRARPQAVEALQQKLRLRQDVAALEYVSPEQALRQFEMESGMGSALSSLDNNPLPPTLLLTPAAGISAADLGLLGEQLAQLKIVDEVLFDRAWIERLQGILTLGERIALVVGALLALGVVLVIGNTIRLAIENRRDEITIIKLVGGSDAFVRRPFLYTGLWYGLGGGLLALVMVLVLLFCLSGAVASLASSYQSDYSLQGLGFSGSLLLVLTGTLVGWLGAWLAVGRHLGAIEP
jgi:cell division transport system permease protein